MEGELGLGLRGLGPAGLGLGTGVPNGDVPLRDGVADVAEPKGGLTELEEDAGAPLGWPGWALEPLMTATGMTTASEVSETATVITTTLTVVVAVAANARNHAIIISPQERLTS